MSDQGRRGDRSAAVLWLLAGSFALFFLLPLGGLLQRGLSESGTWDYITSATARDALWLSLWTSTLTTGLAVVFGTPAAYLLSRAHFRGQSLVEALIDLPIVLPPTVAGVALLAAFGRRGVLGEPLDELTGITFGFTTAAVVMAQFIVAAPFFVRAARAGFDSVDPQFEQVAHTLGASPRRAFLRVVVPLAWPSLGAGLVLCWARAMGELGATLIFAGNFQGRTQTMPLAIIEAFESSAGLAGAVALSLLLLAVALLALVAFRVAQRGGAYR